MCLKIKKTLAANNSKPSPEEKMSLRLEEKTRAIPFFECWYKTYLFSHMAFKMVVCVCGDRTAECIYGLEKLV